MKRERRHELQHNDLAEWIIKSYERIVPYKNAIIGAGLLAVVLVIAMSVWHSHSVAQAGEAWNSLGVPVFFPIFANEQTVDMMQHAAQTNAGTPAAEWAEVFAGDSALMVGTNKILTDKKAGIESLTKARDIYANALKTVTIPAAREQAMFGKARALESLIQNKDELDKAVAAYQELNQTFPNGMFKPVAEQRIEHLQKKDSLTFYEALAQYTPKPKVQSSHSQSGNLGSVPENPPDEPPVPRAPVRDPNWAPNMPVPTLTPKTEAPKTEAPKKEAPKTVAPKTEAPKTEPAKPQLAKPDIPKTEAPKPDSPKKDK